MIIESEIQYQTALKRITELVGDGKSVPQVGTVSGNELADLVTEVKIYENRYHKEGEEEIQTYEFWSVKEGYKEPDPDNPDSYEIVKLKENELTEKHITMLVAEFINRFDKLPPAAKRSIRIKLRY